jgi:prophage tail gpP-like protein
MSDAHGMVSGPPPGAADALTLTAGGTVLGGWQRVAVTRGLGVVPASFDIQVTEKFPLTPSVDLRPGMPCTVQIGADLVITGYVDRYTASVSGSDHTIRIQGRSKSEDLVDCAAFVGTVRAAGTQVLGGSALSIAQKIAAPYDVTIQSVAGPGAQIPQFNINLGETAWEIIDRVTRYSKLIAYDMPDGSVMLAQAGKETMASGFTIGQNVEAGSVAFSMDGRYSQYEGHFLSTMALGDDAGVNSPGVGQIVYDNGVPRFRKRYVISEQTQLGVSLAYARALWECNRRAGLSQQFTVTCDGWRDTAGKLWAPNHLAPIAATVLKLNTTTWLIASVQYLRDENGQHAMVTMMDPAAFTPEPVVLQPLMPLAQDITGASNPVAIPPGDAPR